jgi:hypothetical protein
MPQPARRRDLLLQVLENSHLPPGESAWQAQPDQSGVQWKPGTQNGPTTASHAWPELCVLSPPKHATIGPISGSPPEKSQAVPAEQPSLVSGLHSSVEAVQQLGETVLPPAPIPNPLHVPKLPQLGLNGVQV